MANRAVPCAIDRLTSKTIAKQSQTLTCCPPARATMKVTRELFETNTFGVMAVTQAVVPQMRARRSGVVVNVTSSVTLSAMPLAAVYTASKMAIEGFTASLALELGFFDVRVKLVEPGYGPSTAFTRLAGCSPTEFARRPA